MKKSNIVLISILTIIFLISGINFSQATSSSTNTIQSEKANNYLKSLSVEGYTLSPEFNKYTLNYYLVVPTSVSSLEVNAETENEKATKRISGNTRLSNKESTIKIVVTAQNKTTKTYNIIVTKQEDNGLKLTELSIDKATINEPLSDLNFKYTANMKSDRESTDVNVNAVASIESAEIEVIGNTGLESGENIITIILRNGKDTTVYEITVNVAVEKTIITKVENNDFFIKAKDYVTEFFKDENKAIAFLVAVAVILFLLVIILIVKIAKKNKAEKNRENLRKRTK